MYSLRSVRQRRDMLFWLPSMLAMVVLVCPDPACAGKSHLLQKPERHVMLKEIAAPGVTQCETACWEDKVLAEVRPDGTVATEEFVVPDGYVLVVTDIEWTTYQEPASFASGRLLYLDIYLGPTGDQARVLRIGRLIDSNLAAAGRSMDQASMTAGFRVKPGVPICPTAWSFWSGGTARHTIYYLNLHGYLIKSR